MVNRRQNKAAVLRNRERTQIRSAKIVRKGEGKGIKEGEGQVGSCWSMIFPRKFLSFSTTIPRLVHSSAELADNAAKSQFEESKRNGSGGRLEKSTRARRIDLP
eukprot:1744448-Rhodomonas_salina.1